MNITQSTASPLNTEGQGFCTRELLCMPRASGIKSQPVKVCLLLLSLLICITPSLFAQFAGGDGSPQNPWQIVHPRQLSDISLNPNAHYILYADIYLDSSPHTDGEGWVPLGHSNPNQCFTGSFDGNGFTIHGLYINRPEASHQGLFATARNCTIINVRIVDASVTGAAFTGILAGQILNPQALEYCQVEGIVNANGDRSGLMAGEMSGIDAINIENLHAEGTINSSASICGGLFGYFAGIITDLYDSSANVYVYAAGDKVGGLIGWNSFGTDIYRCVAYRVVQGHDNVGGLIGYNNESGWLWYCASKNLVSGHSRVGGLVGFNGKESIIRNCYSRSNVLGENMVGGFTGLTISNSMHVNCYSAGIVNGSSNVGGFCGWDPIYGKVGIFQNCYWDYQLSGTMETCGGMARSTLEMTNGISPTTFVEWDFAEIWQTDIEEVNDGYPTLRQTTVSTNDPSIPPALEQISAYPNPFRESIQISFETKTPAHLSIYNLKGQVIKTFPPGTDIQSWEGKDDWGRKCPSATYIIRLQTGGKSICKRICLLR